MHALAPSFSVTFDLPASSSADADAALAHDYQQGDTSAFLTLIRKHNRAVFHLAHALLRNEVAAETITQQVFARARRHINRGQRPASVVHWLYYATLRFSRHHYWHTERRQGLRPATATHAGQVLDLDLRLFAGVIAVLPGRIEPHDCELLALRHVLGLPLADIARLLRIHPYEASNRLIWARERVLKLSGLQSFDASRDHATFVMTA